MASIHKYKISKSRKLEVASEQPVYVLIRLKTLSVVYTTRLRFM